MKLKVMTIVGTRPEIIRLSEIIKKADKYCKHILVHTGQNWDKNLSDVFFEDLELRKPDYFLDTANREFYNPVGLTGSICKTDIHTVSNLGQTIGNIIAKTYELMQETRPDAVLILGDTNSALSAISAKRLKIPVFHMEAGNRCFDENVPEEINRRIVDHISDINLPYTEHARKNLLNEGLKPEYIFVTGSPIAEVFYANMNKIQNSKILESLKLESGEYFLVSIHREENVDNEETLKNLMCTLDYMDKLYKLPIIVSTHPRTRKKIPSTDSTKIRFCEPFGYHDYNKLQLNAKCVLSDSGTLAEEASILGFPAVSLRTSTERPEAFDMGNLILGGITPKDIFGAIELTEAIYRKDGIKMVGDYYYDNISDKVIKIIQSYTHVINKNVWNKTGYCVL